MNTIVLAVPRGAPRREGPPADAEDMEDDTVRYVMLAVASDQEAQRLIEDLTEHPDEPLRTPRWGNAVHAVLTPTQPTDPPPRRHLRLVDLDPVPARVERAESA